MTPATGWTEQSYYLASRAARQAWKQTDQQLELGLEEIDAGTVTGGGVGLLEPADLSPIPPRYGGLDITKNGPRPHTPAKDSDGRGQRRQV